MVPYCEHLSTPDSLHSLLGATYKVSDSTVVGCTLNMHYRTSFAIVRYFKLRLYI